MAHWTTDLVTHLESLGWVFLHDSSDSMLRRKWHLIEPVSGKVLAHDTDYLWRLHVFQWFLANGKINFSDIPNNKYWPIS